jgi:hypothetical protein
MKKMNKASYQEFKKFRESYKREHTQKTLFERLYEKAKDNNNKDLSISVLNYNEKNKYDLFDFLVKEKVIEKGKLTDNDEMVYKINNYETLVLYLLYYIDELETMTIKNKVQDFVFNE